MDRFTKLLIKHIWIMMDSSVLRAGLANSFLTDEEQISYQWLAGTIAAMGPKEEMMKVEFYDEEEE